ncbi:hypothetical protein [Kitasatospora purpeofusca]|uniref:hypothetical protein n=1 Tax=Kitasatospora purpeofusca TaxID=67352 RepID=UPI003863B7CB
MPGGRQRAAGAGLSSERRGARAIRPFGGSHPLAKRIGAWPAVLAVTGVVAAASAATTALVTRKG